MATRADYRSALTDKLAGIEESGYADFGFSDEEKNTYLELAVAKLFPTFYKKDTLDAQSVVAYGTQSSGAVTLTAVPEDRVYLVEDATELTPVFGWRPRPGKLVGIHDDTTVVNVCYFAPYEMPTSDATTVEWSAEFKPLIVLGALIECLESRQDRGVRPDPERSAGTDALARMESSYERLKQDLGMNLPSVLA